MDILVEFACELGIIRIDQHLSQEKMAERCNLSRRHYTSIENARANPTLTTLYNIKKGSGISLDALIKKCEEKGEIKVKYIAVQNEKGTFNIVGYDTQQQLVAFEEDVSCEQEYAENAARIFTDFGLLPVQLHDIVVYLQGIML